MTMVCGLDLHRRQITFDALEVESGQVWVGRLWQPDRERFRRWRRDDVTEHVVVAGCRSPWMVALVGGTSSKAGRRRWVRGASRGAGRYAGGPWLRAPVKTDRSDCRLLRGSLQNGRLPATSTWPDSAFRTHGSETLEWFSAVDARRRRPSRHRTARPNVSTELRSAGPCCRLPERHGGRGSVLPVGGDLDQVRRRSAVRLTSVDHLLLELSNARTWSGPSHYPARRSARRAARRRRRPREHPRHATPTTWRIACQVGERAT